MPSIRLSDSMSAPKYLQFQVRGVCLAVASLFVCGGLATAQCNCGSQGASIAQPVDYGPVSSQAWPAYSSPQSYRGYESRSGVAQFTHYKTPVGSARGIPGQSVPVQTMVANFAPPSKLSGSSQQTVPRRTHRQPLFRRW